MDVTDSIRKYVNGIDGLTEGVGPPSMEMFPLKEEDPIVYQVQKILTEIYVFTDTNHMKYGSKTFQDVIIMGEMTKDQVETLIAKKRRKGG